MMSALSLASARMSKLWIPFQYNLLDGDLCKNDFYFHIFSFFSGFSNVILSDALIFPVSLLQTQQVMTSQIRSHVEYSIETYYILLFIFESKLMKYLATMASFYTI